MNTPIEAAAEAFREYAWGYTVGDVTDFAGARAVVAAYLKARAEPRTDDGWPTPQAWARQAWAAVLLAELEGDTCEHDMQTFAGEAIDGEAVVCVKCGRVGEGD
jgi:hypothetical protein